MTKNRLTYTQRLESFRAGTCPYCQASGATLDKNKRGLRGHCVVCGAECNFTKEVKEE